MSNYKLLWNRKGQLNKNKEGRLEFRVYLEAIQSNIFVSTKISIKETDFDFQRWVILPSNLNFRSHNKRLRNIQDRLDDTLAYLDKNSLISKELFWETYDPTRSQELKIDNTISFNQFFIDQLNIDFKFKRISTSTFTSIKQSYDKLNEWNTNIKISEINYEFAENFFSFLIDSGLGDGYRKKLFTNLSKYVLRLVKKELITSSKYLMFKDFKVRAVKNDKHALSPFYINEIIELNYKQFSRIDVARDYFLMTAFTGLRYIDISKTLIREDIIINDGGVWLKIRPQKTNEYKTEISLPLHILFDGKPKEIVLKYIDLIKPKDKNPIFPYMGNKELNQNLKALEGHAKIPYHLTHHIGRHTFITRLNSLLRDPELVMNLAGIKDIKTLENYIHIDQSARNKRLKEIDWLE